VPLQPLFEWDERNELHAYLESIDSIKALFHEIHANWIAGMSIERVIMAAMPWLLILLAVLVLVTYLPLISLFLPSMML
jgi:hypothetical protein